ncbi:hypothetical protein T484DRAFT_1823868, partial [Baffinella frigidus]
IPPSWGSNEQWRKVAFPKTLGHMSTCNKKKRLLTDIQHKKQRLLTDIQRCMKLHISANKTEKQRLLTDIQRCMKLHISANETEVNCEYLPVMRLRLTTPLIDKGAEGIDE